MLDNLGVNIPYYIENGGFGHIFASNRKRNSKHVRNGSVTINKFNPFQTPDPKNGFECFAS